MLCPILCRGDLVSSDIAMIISPEIIFDVLIFNPFTREVKVLPFIKVPEKPPNKESLRIQFGFGLSNNMTWKIIMLLSFEDSNLEMGGIHHDIVMVCSQVGDVWSSRQIDATLDSLHLPLLLDTRDFYLNGRYYWKSFKGHLVWFDMDDEVFGKIELPSNVEVLDLYTVMNDSIALFTFPQLCTENEVCIEIWVMDENNNNINWHKQASFFSSKDILGNEYFDPIGIWNPNGHLLVFSGPREVRYTNYNSYYNDPLVEEFYFKEGCGSNLISIDLETHEKKTIFTSQERKSTLTIGFNPTGHVQVCNERRMERGDLVSSDIAEIISPEIIFDVLIFNPFTREVKVLPFIKVPEKPPNKEGLQIQFGFGLSNNMTWKIITLLSFEDSNLERGGSHHDIVMVSSQEGDVWSWRQIDAALDSLHLNLLFDTREFYFKGRYYWQSFKGHLVWFDMDDEVFGKIELPSNVEVLDYTVMNESIALFTFPQPCTENEVIWK
nr:putative F-box protein At1g19160 [Ipomoea batatas]